MGLVRLTEVCGTGAVTTNAKYALREVFVNPEHVVMVREEHRLRRLNEEGLIDKALDTSHRFSKITIDKGNTGTEIVVIGAPEIIEKTLHTNKQILRG
jgi:ketopantoate reductase